MPDIKSGEIDVSPTGPGGEGSGSGGGGTEGPPGNWTTIPCPGFCPVWPSKYVYVKIPGGTSYVCPSSPAVTIAATTTYLQLKRGPTPGWVRGTCTGMGWFGTSTFTPDPMIWEGTSTIRIFVCCDTELTSYPRLWFYYEDHIRLIGEPDPDIHACFENACMTIIQCECTTYPDTGLPGYTHGKATLANTDLPLYYGTCDCNIAVVGGGEEFEVKSFGFGACDCVGIPTGLPAVLQCVSLGPDPPPGMVTVASGSMSYTEVDSIVFPNMTGPHWEGTMASALGDGCYWDVAMFYNPTTDSMGWLFQGPNGTGCINFCPPFSIVTSLTGSCDPFYIQANYDGGQAIFTIGTPP